jgi:branched-chain amino acid transport system substrate-binding protein
MKQAANVKDFRTTNLLPPTINTGPIDFAPIKVQLRRFKREKWELFGPTLGVEIGGKINTTRAASTEP